MPILRQSENFGKTGESVYLQIVPQAYIEIQLEMTMEKKKWLNRNIYKLHNDTWDFTTWLFIGKQADMDIWMQKKFKYDPDGKDTSAYHAGEAFKLADKDGGVVGHFIWLPEFTFTCDDYATLSHEALRVAVHALYDRDVEMISENRSETLNYLHHNIFRGFLRQLFADYKECSKTKPQETIDSAKTQSKSFLNLLRR